MSELGLRSGFDRRGEAGGPAVLKYEKCAVSGLSSYGWPVHQSLFYLARVTRDLRFEVTTLLSKHIF